MEMDMASAGEYDLLSTDDDNIFLVIYADLVTLILVFFILLYALSARENHAYKEEISRMHDLVQEKVPEPPAASFVIEELTGLRPRHARVKKALSRFMREETPNEKISLRSYQGKMILDISGESVFASGSADLNPQARPLFEKLAVIFKQFPDYTVNIKGHTDNVPIATSQFPSNWELSAIRATTVLKYFIEQGMEPWMLTATGYGESMPKVPNISDANRAENRRVEFVLEKKDSPF